MSLGTAKGWESESSSECGQVLDFIQLCFLVVVLKNLYIPYF